MRSGAPCQGSSGHDLHHSRDMQDNLYKTDLFNTIDILTVPSDEQRQQASGRYR